MNDQNREKITLWLKPDLLRRMDGWLEEDNCSNRREFIEKALRFYMGYLATDDIGCLSDLLSDSRARGGVGCGIVHSKSSCK